MLLNINFTSYLTKLEIIKELDRPRPASNPDNTQFAVNIRHITNIYKWLYNLAKDLVQEWEREIRSAEIPDNVVEIVDYDAYLVPSRTSNKSYITTPYSCTCPDHKFRNRECIHMKRLRSSIAYNPSKSALPNTDHLSDEVLALVASEARECLF